MININSVKTQVDNLAAKGQHSYDASTQFNPNAQSANRILFDFYQHQFEQNSLMPNAIRGLIVNTDLAVDPQGFAEFPQDFGFRTALQYRRVINTDCGNKIDDLPVDYMASHERPYVLSSAIRKPSISKGIIRHSFEDGKIRVYPNNVGKVQLTYVKQPATPFWGSTIVSTPDGDFEQYDPTTSTDFEYPWTEEENLVNLILAMLGIEIRETALIQYAQGKFQQQNA